MPPASSGGICLAEILNQIETTNLRLFDYQSPEHIQLVVEAEKRAYSDRAEYMGDTDFVEVPIQTLISDEYAKKRISNYNPESIIPSSDIKPGLTELINRQIAPLQAKISSMLSSADSLFLGVSNVLDNNTQINLKTTLQNLSNTTQNLNEASYSLIKILDDNQNNLKKTFLNFANTSANLKTITDSISNVNIELTISQFNNTLKGLNSIVSSIDSGNGTLGKLVNDEYLYKSLINASEELESLISDLKKHPKRYVNLSIFGKKEKPYIPEKKNK